ncbi:hypothetical protein SCUCBS95973_000106 [Sporothrix curviconia]|uniref:F-box domain-containing protein n=1 Tax=Sporothrix curviconia TaxID=1260050 RepID=A0ABP0AMS5_9PEZI
MANFDDVPDELVVAILYLIPSSDIADSVQLLSRRFYHLSQEPKLWLARCRGDFVHWSTPARARLARAGRANRGPWKQMWLDRRRGDASTTRHFEHVLASKVNRVRHLEAICRRGLDAKDFLLEQYHLADDAADDVLARRYYASTALASIHRGLAIEEWCKVRADYNGYRPLDRALGAFDMFVLHDGAEDMDRIEEMFDELADEFRRDQQQQDQQQQDHHRHHQSLDTMTVREKAFALVRWIRMRRLAGMADPGHNYRNVRNCLIGHALTDPDHPSLPIISSAIFVSIGERIGLRTFCCAVPGHVHVTILGAPGESVDGTPLDPETLHPPRPGPPIVRHRTLQERMMTGEEDGSALGEVEEEEEGEEGEGERFLWQSPSSMSSTAVSPLAVAAAAAPQIPHSTFQMQQLQSSLPDNGERMFLDPYNSDQELTLQRLREGIAEVDWGIMENRDIYMMPSPTSAIVLRVALNLEASWTHANQVVNVPLLSAEARRLRRGDSDMNLEALLYATMWATVLMRPLDSTSWDRQLDNLLARFAHFYSEDVWIIEQYLLPLYDRHMALSYDSGSYSPARTGGDTGNNNEGAIGGEQPPAPPAPPAWRHQHLLSRAQQQQQQQRLRGWSDPRVMIKMAYNLDQRLPVVSRRYTQDIHDKVLYRIGQVFRHRRFDYVGIINGWSPDDPTTLPSPNNMSMTETASSASDAEDSSGSGRVTPVPSAGADVGGGGGAGGGPRRRKSAFYTCLRLGVERQVVAQRNIEIVTDPAAIPPPLMFLAGKHFKRFVPETCTFVSNLREFFPDD